MPSPVNVEVKSIEIPTYVLGPDSPYPSLTWRAGRGSYPYSTRLDISAASQPVQHRAVVLENQYVRATILPDMGGRLFSLYDKVAGQETFMTTPTIKYQNIAVRGAWIAGGIEWNFGHRGHTVVTVNPVSWAVRKDADGGASVWVGAVVRPIESRWAVRMGLKPDRAVLDVEIMTMGPQTLPGLMYWWTNAAVQVGQNSRFYYFGAYAGDWTPHSWPMTDGADFSWYRNRTFGSDMFLMEPQRDYLGFYDYDRNHGLAQTADRFLSPGQKYFTWGADQRGRFWDLLLSDSEQTYCEIQRGRLPSQGKTEPIPPMSVDTWTEQWLPINQTQGFSGLQGDLVIAVNREADPATVRLLAARPMKGLKLEAFGTGGSLGTWTVPALEPGKPAVHRFELPDRQEIRRAVVADAAGAVVMDWQEFDFSREDWYKTKPTFHEDKASLEELFEEAERRRFLNWPGPEDWAKPLYDKILAIDPGHSGTLRALAETDLFDGRLEAAQESISKALKRRPADPQMLCLLGWTLMAQNKPAEAIEPLVNAGRYEPGRVNALAALVWAYIQAGQFDKALAAAKALLAERPANRWARLAAVTALRKAGQTEQAKAELNKLLEIDPLWSRANAEALLLGIDPKLAAGERRLADDALTAGLPYLELAQWQDARIILSRDESDEHFSPALRLAHLAYAQHKLGDKAGVEEILRQIRQAAPEHASPWATSSIKILSELAEAYPAEPMIQFMLGNVLSSRRRVEDALAAWQRAAELGMEHHVLARNIAAAESHNKQYDAALSWYRKAWKLSKADMNLFSEFDRFLSHRGLHSERDALYRDLPEPARSRSMVALRRVPQLLDLERVEEGLAELNIRTFLPGEVQERVVRRCFLEALLAKGLEHIVKGDLPAAEQALKEGLTYPRNHNAGRRAYQPDESMMKYMLGLVAELAGQAEQARLYWQSAANEQHSEGELTQAYEMLAWLALGERARAMVLAHRLEQYDRGEATPWDWFFGMNTPSMLKLTHGMGQLAKGHVEEAVQLWKQGLESEPDGRYLRPHLRMPVWLLERMARKTTGPMKK